jgi:SH3-like domain-containing protein
MRHILTLLALCAALTGLPAAGQDATVTPAAATQGKVTNLPLPRFVSLKAAEGNVRRGPSLTHRIDWVFRHRDMPLEVTAEFENWRRVEDQDGQGGWIHYSLLSGVRTVVIAADTTDLHSQPDDTAEIVARAEPGVIARLEECTADWCRIRSDGERGWVHKTAIWGVGADEVRD